MKLYKKIILNCVAVLLHGVSSFLLFVGVGIGEAWSGYGRSHYFPVQYAFVGTLIILSIGLIPKIIKNKESVAKKLNSKLVIIIISVIIGMIILINNSH